MLKPSMLLALFGIGMFAMTGCQDTVEDEATDVIEARGDVQEEKVEGLSEIEGEAAEADREITDERQELQEETKELNEVINEKTTPPAETNANVEGDADALEEVEPQN